MGAEATRRKILGAPYPEWSTDLRKTFWNRLR